MQAQGVMGGSAQPWRPSKVLTGLADTGGVCWCPQPCSAPLGPQETPEVPGVGVDAQVTLLGEDGDSPGPHTHMGWGF